MKVFIKGKKQEVNLTQKNFVAAGGQGSVYHKQGIAYKVYTDITKMIPEAKIMELSVLTSKNIIKPENILLNSKNKIIGYTMKYLEDTIALCQIFTESFKRRNNITPERILELIKQFREDVEHCHSKKILLVDINQLNFVINKFKLNTIFFIDVDNYQTKSYPAQAIMMGDKENIRDYHTKGFTELSDWFSFGILSFQMLTGIHPYQGKHKDYKTLEEKMKNNISVFHKGIGLPPVIKDFSQTVPTAYLNWYTEVFENGKRIPFPLEAVVHINIQLQPVKAISVQFDINEKYEFDGNIIDFKYADDKNIFLTDNGLFIIKNGVKQRNHYKDIVSYAKIGITPKYSYVFTAIVKNHELLLKNVENNKIYDNRHIKASEVFSCDNRLYFLGKDKEHIYEILFSEISTGTTMVSFHPVCNTLASSVQVFDGVVMQNLLGSYFVTIFPQTKKALSYNIKELAEHRVINAKYVKNVLMIIAEHNQKYDKFIIRFEKFEGHVNSNTYDLRKIEDVHEYDINFNVLDNGTVCHIMDDENIELFHNSYNNSMHKIIKDNVLYKNNLFHKGNDLHFSKGNKFFSIKSK